MEYYWQYVLLPFLSVSVGAWLTAYLALGRFRREREWERKATAYTAIFEALYDMGRWFDEHMTELLEGRTLSEEKQQELGQAYRKAKGDLERRLAAEVWLIPDECRARLQISMRGLTKEDHNSDWLSMLEDGEAIIDETVRDLRILVRRDLGLDHNEVWSARKERALSSLPPKARSMIERWSAHL